MKNRIKKIEVKDGIKTVEIRNEAGELIAIHQYFWCASLRRWVTIPASEQE